MLSGPPPCCPHKKSVWLVLRFVVSCLYIKMTVNYEWYSPVTAYSGWRSAQHAADLLCHDGCPGHTIPSADTHPAGFWTRQSSPPRMMSISSQHAAGASYALLGARLEVEEDEEDEYGVSLEAPTQTSAAITQSPSHSLPPALSLHCLSSFWPLSVSEMALCRERQCSAE